MIEDQPELLPTPFEPPLPEPPLPEKEDVFWGWHDICLFIFITVMSLGLAMLASYGVKHLFHVTELRMNIVFVLGQFAAYAIAFTCLRAMFLAEYGEPLLLSLHWLPARVEATRLILFGLGQAFVIAMIGALMRVPHTETPMNKLLADRPTAIVIAILGVTLAPLAEELAFRGLLQPLMVRTLGVFPGILLTSLLLEPCTSSSTEPGSP
jgi:membrane protease YdiL (CAAX protease family)